jgi:hypothetical protein
MLCRCELWYNEILILKYLFAIEEEKNTKYPELRYQVAVSKSSLMFSYELHTSKLYLH